MQLSDSVIADNPLLAMTREELNNELRRSFARSPRFVLLDPSTSKKPTDEKPLSCRLEVAFAQESEEEEGLMAEVGVIIDLRRSGEVDHFTARGLGRARLASSEPTVKAKSFRNALVQALDQALEDETVQLLALEKTDAQLIKDLAHQNGAIRDCAVRVLADRKSKAAVSGLIDRLHDDEPEIVLHAMGALKVIGDPRAVPALIEMGHTRDPKRMLPLIDVVASLGGKDAEAFLFTLASGHPDDTVRQAAQEAQDRLKTH